MVASQDTLIEVIQVLRKHLDKPTLLKVLANLKEVDGNESFRLTINRMYEIISNGEKDVCTLGRL